MTCAPDYLEPVEGWRVWAVVDRGGRTRLRSLFFDLLWERGKPASAVCLHRRLSLPLPRRYRRTVHAAPDEGCSCGIYATSRQSALLSYLDGACAVTGEVWRVFGRVALWGEVVECEAGWRAQTAYPTHLFVPWTQPRHRGRRSASDAERVWEELLGYEVPVELVSPDDEALRLLSPAF